MALDEEVRQRIVAMGAVENPADPGWCVAPFETLNAHRRRSDLKVKLDARSGSALRPQVLPKKGQGDTRKKTCECTRTRALPLTCTSS